MENDEEQKARGRLRLAASQARVRLPLIEIETGGVTYSTQDPETLLIGELGVGGAHYIGGETARAEFNRDLIQLWRTKDGHYFCYSNDGITPVKVETAHLFMDKDILCRQYLTDAHKRELELDDERRNPRARWPKVEQDEKRHLGKL
ncbi:MAG TPA: hypothetical protein VEB88_01720 [Candidatus Acidoferrales bacterium]|nr:hypothetical protein [Candidatus Acidoferrales bacterium]